MNSVRGLPASGRPITGSSANAYSVEAADRRKYMSDPKVQGPIMTHANLRLKADVSRGLISAVLNVNPYWSDDRPGLVRVIGQVYEDAVQSFESSPNIDILFSNRVAHKLAERYRQSRLQLNLTYTCELSDQLQIGTKNSIFELSAIAPGELRLTMAPFKSFPLLHNDHRDLVTLTGSSVHLYFETEDVATLPKTQKYLFDLATESRFLLRHVDRFLLMCWKDTTIESAERLAQHCAEVMLKHLKPLTVELKLCRVKVSMLGKGLRKRSVVAKVGESSTIGEEHTDSDYNTPSASSSTEALADCPEHRPQPETPTATKQAALHSEVLSAGEDKYTGLANDASDEGLENDGLVLDMIRRSVSYYRARPGSSTAEHSPTEESQRRRQAAPEAKGDQPNFGDGNLPNRSLSHVAFIAIGSNVGERFETLQKAFSALSSEPGIRIVNSSFLYETEPMYVQDQGRFINGVVVIKTSLPPLELLDRLQDIERHLDRVKTIDKGPRTVDLDILTYDDDNIDHPRLTVPHAHMHEREFVLRPLLDTLGLHPREINPSKILAGRRQQDKPMYTCSPLAPAMQPLYTTDPNRPAHIMAILNMTPDSFSDGGLHQHSDIEHLKSKIIEYVASGATIIDVGGQSSRPNAPDIDPEEELARILPAIEGIKSLPEAHKVAISVDTYRAKVAEAAVQAGAHIVNDISAGLLDPHMLPTIAKLGCTYVAMHMRGTPATMTSAENCSYPKGVIHGVRDELEQRVEAALAAGISRWRIILDPGIGFAKTQDQNLEILRYFYKLPMSWKLKGFPWLVGSSRKGFIGNITGVKEASERTWGTAATVTAAIQGGADVVRVHDVEEMAKVAKMACAIYRRPHRQNETTNTEMD